MQHRSSRAQRTLKSPRFLSQGLASLWALMSANIRLNSLNRDWSSVMRTLKSRYSQ